MTKTGSDRKKFLNGEIARTTTTTTTATTTTTTTTAATATTARYSKTRSRDHMETCTEVTFPGHVCLTATLDTKGK